MKFNLMALAGPEYSSFLELYKEYMVIAIVVVLVLSIFIAWKKFSKKEDKKKRKYFVFSAFLLALIVVLSITLVGEMKRNATLCDRLDYTYYHEYQAYEDIANDIEWNFMSGEKQIDDNAFQKIVKKHLTRKQGKSAYEGWLTSNKERYAMAGN